MSVSCTHLVYVVGTSTPASCTLLTVPMARAPPCPHPAPHLTVHVRGHLPRPCPAPTSLSPRQGQTCARTQHPPCLHGGHLHARIQHPPHHPCQVASPMPLSCTHLVCMMGHPILAPTLHPTHCPHGGSTPNACTQHPPFLHGGHLHACTQHPPHRPCQVASPMPMSCTHLVCTVQHPRARTQHPSCHLHDGGTPCSCPAPTLHPPHCPHGMGTSMPISSTHLTVPVRWHLPCLYPAPTLSA